MEGFKFFDLELATQEDYENAVCEHGKPAWRQVVEFHCSRRDCDEVVEAHFEQFPTAFNCDECNP